jgi:hypothetical protein
MNQRIRDGLAMLVIAAAVAVVGLAGGGEWREAMWFIAALVAIGGLIGIATALLNPAGPDAPTTTARHPNP